MVSFNPKIYFEPLRVKVRTVRTLQIVKLLVIILD